MTTKQAIIALIVGIAAGLAVTVDSEAWADYEQKNAKGRPITVIWGFESPDGGSLTVPQAHVPVRNATTCPEVCATTAGDGGTLNIPVSRCRMYSTGNACINFGAAVTSCATGSAVAPNGMRIAADSAEEFTPVAATLAPPLPTPDAGPADGSSPGDAAVYYVTAQSGTACVQCCPLTPQP